MEKSSLLTQKSSEEILKLKTVFFHDVDEKGQLSNFKYVLVNKNTNVSLSQNDQVAIFDGDGNGKFVSRKNLSEISPGSVLAAMFTGSNLVDINDFKKASSDFFKEKGLDVKIYV